MVLILGIIHGSSSDKRVELADHVFARRERGSREVCNREHWSATSDQELVCPVILMLLAAIKRALVSLASKHRMACRILIGLAQVSKCAT